MTAWGVLTLRILDALETLGPMTAGEIARELGEGRDTVASAITRLRRPTKRPKAPKRVHVCEWRDEDEGYCTYLRAVYALGNRTDAKRPPRKSLAERSRRYRANLKARRSSVLGGWTDLANAIQSPAP